MNAARPGTINPAKSADELFEYYSIPAYQETQRPDVVSGKEIGSAKLLLESGTVLFGKLNPRVEKVWRVGNYSEHRKIGSTEWIPIVPATGVDEKFLYFLLWSEHVMPKAKTLVSGSTPSRQRVDPRSFYRLEAPLPPLAEQRKIAAVLGLVQRALEQQERLIALTTELKKAFLHQLFTQGLRGEPQKQTEIGPVPESWEVVRLGDVFHTQLGKMLSQKAHLGQAPKPYLRNQNVQWGRIDVADLLEMDFNERELTKHRLEPGDLLVCEGGEPGRTALWNGEISECYYQKALHRLRPKDERVTNRFLAHWLMFSLKLQNLYGVTGASSTIAHLPEVQLKALPIRSEQDEICIILEAADHKLGVIEKKHAALTALFRTLLHQLMTAQIRVHNLNLPELESL